MIREVPERPECFSHIPPEAANVFVEGFNDRGVYGYLGFNVTGDIAQIHLYIIPGKFKPSVFREIKKDWHKVVKMCYVRKAKTIIVINPNPDKRWFKFIRIFGFNKPLGVAKMRI